MTNVVSLCESFPFLDLRIFFGEKESCVYP